eukprot:CAMPEP_0204271594 /NCGR_PEP_ID=MMETSP0468-20130131/20420_1 /ASSEMBLY_ACC=CAM_ASM_000383 /TAXON_ID=2969 /ORGANISM="Oxyrrhis marina" /LENGTH=107 /DNA_ID=CAMNT_0051247307 /DNA_START=43 /DNA_END=366 /DNA_ORIENTATION=+
MPVRHIVMFTVQDEATEAQIGELTSGLLALPEKIPEIKGHELGVDMKLPSGQAHPAGKNRSIAWTADFDNDADYETYAAHPDHVACIKEKIAPIIVPGTRAAIQYVR